MGYRIQLVSATIHPIAVALAPPGSGLGIGRLLHFALVAAVRAVNTRGTGLTPSVRKKIEDTGSWAS